jgi:Spy/CpxP family protein refolding chaperone
VRRLIVSIYAFALMLALPATAFAAAAAAATTDNTGKPSGHDWTITSIFVIALFIPALLAFLTLIDIARGKHTQRDH